MFFAGIFQLFQPNCQSVSLHESKKIVNHFALKSRYEYGNRISIVRSVLGGKADLDAGYPFMAFGPKIADNVHWRIFQDL
jgi:hypothetical protein